MKKTIIYLFRFSVFLSSINLLCFGCQNSKKPLESDSKIEIISISDTITPQTQNYNEYFDSVRFVFLETNDHSFISQISNLVWQNNEIVIHDRKLAKVVVFDNSGNFVNEIKSKNDSAGYPKDIQCISGSSDNLIYMLDNRSSTIFGLNPAGRVERMIPVKGFPLGIFSFDDRICLFQSIFNEKTRFLFRIVDKKGKNIPSFDFMGRSNLFVPDTRGIRFGRFYSLSHNNYLFSAEENCVYNISDTMCPMVKKINFVSAKPENENHYEIIGFTESKSLIFIDVIINRLLFNFIYQKDTGKMVLLNEYMNSKIHLFGLSDNTHLGFPIWPSFVLNDEWMCQIIDMPTAKKFCDLSLESEGITKSIRSNVFSAIQSKNSLDNSIVVFLHLKNHENPN